MAKLPGGYRVVVLDSQKLEYQIVGTLPPGYDPLKDQFWRLEISLAGESGCDGLYAVEGFTLWFFPESGKWGRVIVKVNIRKTFGGAMPWLPVAYLGEERFAVSKTIKDGVPVPAECPDDQSMFGGAEGVTMLIDGRSGEMSFYQPKESFIERA